MLHNIFTIVTIIGILIASSFIRAKYKIHRFLIDASAILTIYEYVFRDPSDFILPKNDDCTKIKCGRYRFTFSNLKEGKLKFEKIILDMLEYYEDYYFIFKLQPKLLEYQQKILNVLIEMQKTNL